jgi:hypothetical protein
VVGTDDSALEAVVAADVELMLLRAEEAEIQARLNTLSLDAGAEGESQPSTSAANDADNDRLAEIYERLAVRAARLWRRSLCRGFCRIFRGSMGRVVLG